MSVRLPVLQDKSGHRESKEDPDSVSTTPNIFSFYNYLRTHPLLLRLRLASTSLKQRRAILTGQRREMAGADAKIVRHKNKWTYTDEHMHTCIPSTHHHHKHTHTHLMCMLVCMHVCMHMSVCVCVCVCVCMVVHMFVTDTCCVTVSQS